MKGEVETLPMDLQVGDVVQVKKKHPCGSDQWRIMRRGMDFRIRCQGCDHEIWLPRPKFEKMIKKVIYQAPREPRT